jgi:hypothetical protein
MCTITEIIFWKLQIAINVLEYLVLISHCYALSLSLGDSNQHLEKYGTSFPEQKNFYSEYGVVIADPFT